MLFEIFAADECNREKYHERPVEEKRRATRKENKACRKQSSEAELKHERHCKTELVFVAELVEKDESDRHDNQMSCHPQKVEHAVDARKCQRVDDEAERERGV